LIAEELGISKDTVHTIVREDLESKNVWRQFCDRFLQRHLLTVSRSFMNVANNVLLMLVIILKANKVNLFVSSVLFVFWYHSPNVSDTPPICNAVIPSYKKGKPDSLPKHLPFSWYSIPNWIFAFGMYSLPLLFTFYVMHMARSVISLIIKEYKLKSFMLYLFTSSPFLLLEIKVFFLCTSFLSVALSWSSFTLFEQELYEVSGKPYEVLGQLRSFQIFVCWTIKIIIYHNFIVVWCEWYLKMGVGKQGQYALDIATKVCEGGIEV
jgi:hypothetical protein